MQGLSLRESNSKKAGLTALGPEVVVSGLFFAGDAGVPDWESGNELSSDIDTFTSVLLFSP
jgi:hypothetical protein